MDRPGSPIPVAAPPRDTKDAGNPFASPPARPAARGRSPPPPTPEEEFSGGGPRPLDFDALLAAVAGEEPSPQVRPGMRMGHVHLHVADIAAGLAFYRDLIGFEVWAQMPSAAFVSAGGYHHHL